MFVNKDFFVCGGTEPNIFRLIEVRNNHVSCKNYWVFDINQ